LFATSFELLDAHYNMVILLALLGFGYVASLSCIGFEVSNYLFSKMGFAFTFGNMG
jgi:hypothetical protein